uniref:Neur_chan_memb domain-containing protein n=1 Tax=Steinernema glaseri TaxID=37863 RepID=A0A1I7ZE53_9BILA
MNKAKIRKAQKRVERLELLEVDFYQPPCTCASRSCNPNEVPKLPWRYRMRKWFKKPTYLPAQIDFYARFLAPAGFLCFNIVYWSSCWIMTAKEDYAT